MKKNNLSINKLSNKLVESLINNKDRLGLKVSKGPLGCQIIDAGIEANGSLIWQRGNINGENLCEIIISSSGTLELSPSDIIDSYPRTLDNVNIISNSGNILIKDTLSNFRYNFECRNDF